MTTSSLPGLSRSPRARAALATTALLLTLATACGTDDDPAASATEPATTPPVAQTSAPAPAPLGLDAHVVAGHDLPGFVAQDEPVVQDLKTFARQHDKTVAELRRTGMVAGAGVMFDPAGAGEGFGMSVAARFGTEDQATTEAERLFAANAEPEDGMESSPIEVPGVPGAHAVTLSGRQGGTSFTGVEIVFADGVVTHELFAFGEDSDFDPQAMVAAATELYERVAGHPLAG
jgi:hypothetical protein